MGKTLTTEEFIARAKEVHGDRYDYSEVVYVNSTTPVCVICKIHGKFYQTPNVHLKGRNCLSCREYKYKQLSKDDFISLSNLKHNNTYDYSQIDYQCMYTLVDIICPLHGIFKQKPKTHINGGICPQCLKLRYSNDNTYSTDNFISKAIKVHNDKYNYEFAQYTNSKNKVKIVCKIHGIFTQTASSHLRGVGCPYCKESKGEAKITNILNNYNIEYYREHKFNECKHIHRLPFDFYIPTLNVCIEYDGKHHFIENDYFGVDRLPKTQYRDSIKTQYCIDNNINLVRIPYWEFDNIENILSSILDEKI